MDNPQLNMGKLRSEFAMVAKACRSDAFFAEMIFEEAPQIFHSVKAQQVPYIFHLPGNQKVSLKSMDLDRAQKMVFDTVQAKYPWSAEVMSDFFAKRGLRFAEIDRPSLVKSPLFPVMVVGAVLGAAALLYVAVRIGLVTHPAPWAIASIAVFWFSVSGGMYNIIRGMPLFIRNKEGRIQFFLGRGSSLGAEGFIIGTGYVAFSLAIALQTYAVPRIRNKIARTAVSYVLAIGAGYMAMQLFMVYMQKTGYKIHSYLL